MLQVDLYESGTIAIVEAVSPELGNRVQRVRVQVRLLLTDGSQAPRQTRSCLYPLEGLYACGPPPPLPPRKKNITHSSHTCMHTHTHARTPPLPPN